jgi:hypothetical protein
MLQSLITVYSLKSVSTINGYVDVSFWERKAAAQGLRIADEKKSVYSSCIITSRKYDIITTRHNPATQQISIRVSRFTFLTNVSVFTPWSKYVSIPEAMWQFLLSMAVRNQRLTKLTV